MRSLKNICFLCCLLLVNDCLSQVCQGSLGDPVVNIDFGQGSNPGRPLSAATTSYSYVFTSCPNDGMYTVVNSTSGCFGDTWHTISQDHTGNAQGYFMLVNASYQPGDFYLDTVHGLCGNTTYEFAAWVVNVLKPSACGGNAQAKKPNLVFSIETLDGNTLNSLSTGDILATDAPIWKQYALSFKTQPGQSDIVVRLHNNAPGGCGNDLAVDDITFRACGPQVSASVAGSSSNEINVCDNNKKTYTLNANVSAGYSTPSYQWQVSMDSLTWVDIAGATTTTYQRQSSAPGNYFYRIAVAEAGNISSPNCRVVSNKITFHVYGKLVTSVTSNSPACEGTTLTLNATGGGTYQWQGPDNFNATGIPANINNVTIAATGKYYVTVTSNAGCVQKDSVIVSVVPKPIAKAGTDQNICEGSSVTLHASGGDTYAWQPAEGLSSTNIADPVASPADSTAYIVTVTNVTTGCSDNDTVQINVFSKPTANAGPDKTMMEGDQIKLAGTAGGSGVNYYWTPAVYMLDGNTLQPTVSPPTDFTYTLHVESTAGCGIATDDVFVKVFKKVIVPNAFSPNKDGINDTWRLVSIDAYPDADISVFNRYGQEVFVSHGYEKPWDGTYKGKLLPVASYYYVIDLKFGLPKLKGWVVVLY